MRRSREHPRRMLARASQRSRVVHGCSRAPLGPDSRQVALLAAGNTKPAARTRYTGTHLASRLCQSRRPWQQQRTQGGSGTLSCRPGSSRPRSFPASLRTARNTHTYCRSRKEQTKSAMSACLQGAMPAPGTPANRPRALRAAPAWLRLPHAQRTTSCDSRPDLLPAFCFDAVTCRFFSEMRSPSCRSRPRPMPMVSPSFSACRLTRTPFTKVPFFPSPPSSAGTESRGQESQTALRGRKIKRCIFMLLPEW
jgi:hypothetical protein